MKETTTYNFKMNRAVPRWKKVLAVATAAFPIAIALYFLIPGIDKMGLWWPVVIMVAAVTASVVIYFSIATDRQPQDEVIHLYPDSLDSKHFGKIYFTNILYSHEQTRGLKNTQLEIKLTGGKTKKWQVAGPKITKKDQQTFSDFVQALAQKRRVYIREFGKTFPRDYKVTHTNPSGLWYGLLCFLFIPVLFMPSDINSWGFWVAPLIFIPLFGGIILLIKRTIRKDNVTLFETYLQSKENGRLRYDEIDTMITTDSKINPGLTLILKNKDKIKWRTLNFGSTDTQAVIRQHSELWHFIQDFVAVLNKNTATVDSTPIRKPNKATFDTAAKKPISTTSERTPTAKKPSSRSKKEEGNAMSSAQKRKKIKHVRGKRGRYIAIPISLVIGAMLLAKTCKNNDNPLQDAASNSQESRRQALQLVKGFTKKNGPYLLFTNDTAAKLYVIPEKKIAAKTLLEEMQQRTKKDYVPQKLRDINAGFDFYKAMRYAQVHPDSVNWHLTLLHKKTTIIMGKSSLKHKDSISSVLYIASYTPKVERYGNLTMKAYRKRKGLPNTTERKLQVVLPIHPNLNLNENLKKLSYNQFAELLKTFQKYPKTTKIYVVGKVGKNRMNRSRFKQLVDDLRTILTEHKIDLTGFQVKEVP